MKSLITLYTSTQKGMSALQENLRLYTELTDKINKYNDVLTRLRDKRERITQELEIELSRSGKLLEPLKTKEGTFFRFKKVKVYSGLTKGYLSETLGRLFSDPKKAEAIVKGIYSGRQVSEKLVLQKISK